jgi:hypothetical protein
MNQRFVSIASIVVLDGGHRRRDEAKVRRYAEAMNEGEVFPPLVVSMAPRYRPAQRQRSKAT